MSHRPPILPPVPPISAVIIAKDEEERLPDALRSVAFCDEVLRICNERVKQC